MTQAEWLSQLEACGNDISQEDIINLVFKDGPNALWSDTVNQNHVLVDGMYNYLRGLFPMRVWDDWKGSTELGRIYHAAYIPFDLSIFQRSMQVCDPSSQNECHTDYCEVPKGGISAIPELEMYKTGFKTSPMCIANIRTSLHAKQIALAIVNERFAVDEQVWNMFYTMAMIRMTGHKWVIEYQKDGSGNIIPIENANPYNALGSFRYSYMNPLYPQVGNVENIMPLDLSFLDYFGGALADSRNPNFITKGPRGEPIFELWYPDDWYKKEILDNPDYIDRCKFTMKVPLVNGTSSEADREIVGNFALRSVPALPRFAESTKGGLCVVQPQTQVEVDSGSRSIYDYRDYRNAPFFLIQMIGKGAGEILSRPTLSTGIEGRPIMPISGSEDWVYRNDYDKECNEDLNMPHFRRRYEMGFRALNPDASWGIIARAKKLRLRAPQTCDLQPIFKVTPATNDCSILTIGCNPNNTTHPNNIISDSSVRKVKCTSKPCGDATNLLYTLSILKENQDSIAPNQSPLGTCVCGDTVQVHITDDDGDVIKVRDASIVEIFRPNVVNPNWTVMIKLASVLAAGECISHIGCPDDSPTTGNVVTCSDNSDDDTLEADQIKVVLDSTLNCNVGASVNIEWLDEDDVLIDPPGVVSGTIISVDPSGLIYVIESAEPNFACDLGGDTTCSMKVTCA